MAELLRSFRSAARLSQETLAERAGLSSRTVSDIETGFARSPRLVTVMLLAEALGLSEADRARLQAAGRRRGTSEPAPVPASAIREVTLVGRDAEVEEIAALVGRDDVRLVTLVGPAGVGKTSLALRVAYLCSASFSNGATLVELASTSEPALVPSAVAQALGLRESGEAPVAEHVVAHARDRHVLLVLDNLEHLTPAAAWIGELLAACRRVTVLATSREALHLRSEFVYSVRPLAAAAAIELFVRRAQTVKPGFAITSATSDAVDTIVEHLEGLPLAIELAAPRLTLLPPRALAARLERRLPLLGDGPIDVPRRQQTMHGAIAWSYDLLGPDEQLLFRQLGVLQGGATLDAARAVADADDGTGQPFLRRLAGLVDKSLLSLDEDDDGEPRVLMLEMLREYANERLVECGELAAARRRHAQYMLQFARAAARELTLADQARWLARFGRERANLRCALQWALDEREVDFGLELATSAWRFWWLRGLLSEGLTWHRRFIDLARDDDPAIAKLTLARALRGFTVLLSAAGQFAEALEPCERAIVLHREVGDESGLAACLTSLGNIWHFRGDADRAAALQEEGLAIRRRIGDEAGAATSLSNLAGIAVTRNDFAGAARLGEESASIHRRLGHESGLAHALIKLGLVASAQAEYDRARSIFEECLRLQMSLGDTGSMVYSLANLGSVAFRCGDIVGAMARYREALNLLSATPNRAALVRTLEEAGAALGVDAPARGVRIIAAADALRQTIGSPLFPSEQADYQTQLASLRAALGDDRFETEWRIGACMTVERATEEACAWEPGAAQAEPAR